MDGEAATAFRPEGGPRVGQSASRSRLVTARDAELVAELAGDAGPLPLGPASGPTAGPAAVPTAVAAALLDAVLTQEVPGPGSLVLRLDLRFLAPVRPGDVITGSVEVASLGDGEPVAGLDLRVVRDDGVVAVAGSALCRTAPADSVRAGARAT
jgi:acyl dehydratase